MELNDLNLAKDISLLILDVDGTLTDGSLFYDAQGESLKFFHVHDGMGIKLLQNAGITVAIITAHTSPSVIRRADDLSINYVFQGVKNKIQTYEKLKKELELTDDEIAYMGDDLPDLPIMKICKLAITMPNACAQVKQQAQWMTLRAGGFGAVREACEMILSAQGKLETAIQDFLEQKSNKE